MKKILGIFKYTPVIIGLIIIWVSVLSFSMLFKNENKRQLQLVPETNSFVFKLKFKDFLKSATYSMIFNSKDQKLLNTFQLFIKEQQKLQNKDNDFGINFFSDVLIFNEKYEKGDIYTIVVNLIDKNKFSQNLPAFLTNNQALTIKNEVGIIATYSGRNSNMKAEMENYLDRLSIKQKVKVNNIAKENEFFNLTLNDYFINKNFEIKKGEISSEINERELNISGSFHLKKPFKRPRKWTLRQEYELRPFHVETSFFSPSVQDTLQNFLSKVGLKVPKIEGVSMNYYGLDIQDNEMGIIFTPRFDMILHFENKIKNEDLFFDREQLLKFGFDYNGVYLKAGDIHYAIEKLDERTLFIGFNRNLITKKNDRILMKISGDLGKITEISGGGFVQSMINIIPPYKAAKDFFLTTEEFKITMAPRSNYLLFIRGNIKIQEKFYFYNEFLKFYMTLKGN
jgi:hypothetical protein